MTAVTSFLRTLDWLILVYVVLVDAVQVTLLSAAAVDLRTHRRNTRHAMRNRLLGSGVLPRVSVLAPAYNEQATAVASVTALLTLRYPQLEVVVVNDGSRDDTMRVLHDAFDLEPVPMTFRRVLPTADVLSVLRSRSNPRLVVVDKANGGKADALNVGLCVATGELVCAIDADTLIEPDALMQMTRPFLDRDDCVAVGGVIRVANASTVAQGRVVSARTPRDFLAGVQAVEYLRAFLFGRLGWNRLGGNLIISGAFGLFRREDLLATGGYLHGSVGEDMEIVARLRRRTREGVPASVRFVPDPVAWTEVPTSLRVLGRQRDRWHRGLTQTLWTYRSSWWNPRDGALGLVVYPYFVLVELLAPVVELVGLVGLTLGLMLHAVDLPFAIAFLLFAYGFGALLSMVAILLDTITAARPPGRRDILLLAMWAVVEPIGYRQLTVLWRLRGIVRSLQGRSDWGVMTRTGFAAEGAKAIGD
jgi:cellulose synthase/poly-beta-1,6-N-acetylglucosamine synthase-like glycosyltransferase